MKPVSGTITSSKTISLSKAARALSKFISIENGASQAVSAYLRRASAAFNELVQFHESLKSEKQHKKSRSQTAERINGNLTDEGQNPRIEEPPSAASRGEDGLTNLDEERGDFDDGGRKIEKKKKKKRRELLDERGGDGAEEGEAEVKKKRKKIKMEEGLDDSNEKVNNSKKKKKRKKVKVEDEEE
ncbi:hypothetical protein AAC387_Pa07g3420 [Persea americana]